MDHKSVQVKMPCSPFSQNLATVLSLQPLAVGVASKELIIAGVKMSLLKNVMLKKLNHYWDQT